MSDPLTKPLDADELVAARAFIAGDRAFGKPNRMAERLLATLDTRPSGDALREALGEKRPHSEGLSGEFDAGWNDCRDFVLRFLNLARAALASTAPAGLDPQRLTDAINRVHVGVGGGPFVYADYGAAIAREYAREAAPAKPEGEG